MKNVIFVEKKLQMMSTLHSLAKRIDMGRNRNILYISYVWKESKMLRIKRLLFGGVEPRNSGSATPLRIHLDFFKDFC